MIKLILKSVLFFGNSATLNGIACGLTISFIRNGTIKESPYDLVYYSAYLFAGMFLYLSARAYDIKLKNK